MKERSEADKVKVVLKLACAYIERLLRDREEPLDVLGRHECETFLGTVRAYSLDGKDDLCAAVADIANEDNGDVGDFVRHMTRYMHGVLNARSRDFSIRMLRKQFDASARKPPVKFVNDMPEEISRHFKIKDAKKRALYIWLQREQRLAAKGG